MGGLVWLILAIQIIAVIVQLNADEPWIRVLAATVNGACMGSILTNAALT